MATGRPLSLKARALRLLAQREHSVVELRRKLLDFALRQEAASQHDAARRVREPSPAVAAEIDALMGWLEAGGYLNESRFVESRLRTRAPRYGNLRIREELDRHGVTLSAQARADLSASEVERARAVWRRKFDALPADAAARARQARFLAGRGFSADAIRRVLRDADD